MPAAVLKSLVKKSGKSMADAEHDWNHAKKIVKKEYGKSEDDPSFWALVTGITKKMMGVKESISFRDFSETCDKRDDE